MSRYVKAKHREGLKLDVTFYGDCETPPERHFIADLVKALVVSEDFSDVRVMETVEKEVTL
jgi:hypothetical protein